MPIKGAGQRGIAEKGGRQSREPNSTLLSTLPWLELEIGVTVRSTTEYIKDEGLYSYHLLYRAYAFCYLDPPFYS